MSARMGLLAQLSLRMDAIPAHQLIREHRAEVLREAAATVEDHACDADYSEEPLHIRGLRAAVGLLKAAAEQGEKDTREGESTPQPVGTCGRALSTGKPCPDHPVKSTELTIYRASHESIVMGRYTTRAAARTHCETLMRREAGEDVFLGWVPDHGGEDAPEELCTGEDVECTGYVVTPLTIASEYDEEADE